MRLWIFLLCMIVVTAFSIWGCMAVIDNPEQVAAEVSSNDFTYQNHISKQTYFTTVSLTTNESTFQPVN